MNLSPQASEQLEIQRLRYLQSLSEKREKIEAAWITASNDNWEHASFEHFKTQIHRLAGSAGSYGLDRLGRAAKCLDHLLGTIPENESPADRAQALKQEVLLHLDEAIKVNGE